MREKIGNDFLPAISSREPYMNDHSREHFDRVLENVECILQHNFPGPSSSTADILYGRIITWADTLILLNAIVWHDIGNIYGRRGHAEAVTKCFDTLRAEALYDEHLSRYIQQVARAHSGSGAIEKVIPSSHATSSYHAQDIHLQFLAAALRFADEIDEDVRRSGHRQLGLIPEQNQRFWYFCGANSAMKVSSTAGDHSLEYWLEVESHIPRSEFSRRFSAPPGTVEALPYYFSRLLKIEDERRYCNPFLNSAYYHPGIHGIRVLFWAYERDTSPTNKDAFRFELTDGQTKDTLLLSADLAELHPFIARAANP
jgi:hypothetical protein